MWRKRAQRSVLLLTMEAKYYALSELAKEIKFLFQFLKVMGAEVYISITVQVHKFSSFGGGATLFPDFVVSIEGIAS